MCKESPERGLGRSFRPVEKNEREKPDRIIRGRFVLDAQDRARLLPRLARCPRR